MIVPRADSFQTFSQGCWGSGGLTSSSKTNTEITWGITLVLMFRSVGSILFGIAADRYGRKWPFIVNNVLFIILELVSFFALFSSLKISFLGKLKYISWGVDR